MRPWLILSIALSAVWAWAWYPVCRWLVLSGWSLARCTALPVYRAYAGCFALLGVTTTGHLPQVTIVAGYAVIAALGAGFGVVQLRRMPPETRPVFRARRVALALGTAYGSILTAAVAATVAPAGALAGTLLAGILLIFASRFAARRILLRKDRFDSSADANRISQSSLDALTESRKHDTP